MFHKTGKPTEWYPTKYDTFKLVYHGHYKHQAGSGRSAALELAKDGMLVGTWTKKCAEIGLTPTFAIGSIQKLMTTADPGWTFSEKNADGLTVKEVTGSRSTERAKEKKVKKVEKEAKKAAKGQKTTKAPKASKPKKKPVDDPATTTAAE